VSCLEKVLRTWEVVVVELKVAELVEVVVVEWVAVACERT